MDTHPKSTSNAEDREGAHTIFFIGKPGCGKGTQAKLLSEKTDWPVISAGQQFRTIAALENAVGRKIKSEIDMGFLAPHWFAMYLYQKALFSLPDDTSVIFDGFNRKVAEAELIIDSLTWLARPFSILYISISDEEVHRRLSGRREAEGRRDDTAVSERLKEYYAYTEPAIRIFREAGVLLEIQGEQPPEQIAEHIRTVLSIA
ncbi:nucleoside monophosphate kinase [Patescibacteria group bacterium]|nr:nucleoside monophosphate kinase [Patescibacteria group bacterium]MDE2021434.1 nucleoside monophosphate kinase [Patescibacteria group bacterium]MDE2172994.1 nucleoside monophosphate kinase [Patescibacteria group bacterium]